MSESLYQPLSDRVRPENLDAMVGQAHLFGKNGIVRRMIDHRYFPNLIMFGPPGTGKTTCARIIAKAADRQLFCLNATTASISDVKEVIERSASIFGGNGTMLYLDEIQYFNRKQQQTLLEHIETGRITLIASTTENPYMYIYNAIISRSTLLEFKAVGASDMTSALRRAEGALRENFPMDGVEPLSDEILLEIAKRGAGDVRRAVGLLESLYFTSGSELNKIDTDALDTLSPRTVGNFDASGNVHYDMLSALQKSIRGSDPDAAVFYLAKILTGGDLLGVCRRLRVIANEDIALAYPMAAAVTHACVEDAIALGLPEAALPLSHCVVLLATAPKSNAAHLAYEAAAADIAAGKGQTVPDHMRPLTGYKDYKYPHDFPNSYVPQRYLPDDVKDAVYYKFGENKNEAAAREYWKNIKGER